MDPPARSGLLPSLTVAALTFASGVASPAQALERLPEEMLTELVDETCESRVRPEQRARMLALLAAHRSPGVRSRVAEAAAGLWPDDAVRALALLRQLARDPNVSVRSAVARGLSHLLALAVPLDRTQLVADWTLSREPAERAVIARALGGTTLVYLADLAIAQLAGDRDVRVRRLALRAAREHWTEDPYSYQQLALDHVDDNDPHVRHTARRLAGRIAVERRPV